MSKRLQAATSSRNERCFEPHKESWIPSEEWIKVGGEEVRECLEHACRTNGYRKLELNTCEFKTDKKWFTADVFGGDPRSKLFAPGKKKTVPESVLKLDAVGGSLTIYEANVYVCITQQVHPSSPLLPAVGSSMLTIVPVHPTMGQPERGCGSAPRSHSSNC